ncbi:MAG: glutathione S-transferase family protein [Candidatus Accumulibacter sp.]|jgi:glutathione S-transferase|nr:glutathione S-transferase family protein [Accumulibacter sp.]
MFKLIIGSRNYSSWSLRPWLAAKQAGLSFEEIPITSLQSEDRVKFLRHSPSGKVPCLIDGDTVVWESMSICEYLAEKAPTLWPSEMRSRAEARSIACEMYSGFTAMRQRMPFDVQASLPFQRPLLEVETDVARIVSILESCRQRYGDEGPFLFGHFTNTDAAYAPVVFRFLTYHVDLPEKSRQWVETMATLPAMQEWRQAAIGEAG